MKRNWVLLALVFVILSALAAFAADVSGTWSGTAKGPDGSDFTLTFKLKQDGAKLTGTSASPQGEIEISDGKVDGDKLSFNVSFNGMVISHEGLLKNEDDMALTAKFPEGSGIPDMVMDVKRAK